jgi:hypothetical protein
VGKAREGSGPSGLSTRWWDASAVSFSEASVYQLRVVLRAVSPLSWRRLLIRSASTIFDLHVTLEPALGWSDEHLNRFVIRGRDYGLWHGGGIGFRDVANWYTLPILASASACGSCPSTTLLMAGSTRCAWTTSCRSIHGDAIQSASATG